MLSFNKLEEVLLDVEQCLINKLLMYNKEDPDYLVLTPKALIFGQENAFPTDNDPANIDEKVMRKRQKYIISCKEAVWKRWYHGKWNMDEIRAIKLRAGKDKLERVIHHIFPLELSCDINKQPND